MKLICSAFRFIFLFTVNLWLSSFSLCNAQTSVQFQEIGPNLYTDGISTGKFEEMRHVFQDDGIMEWMYYRYDQNRKGQNIFKTISYLSIAIGTIGGSGTRSTFSSSPFTGAFMGFLVGAVYSLPFYITSTVFRRYKHKRRDQLISYYNDRILPKTTKGQSYLRIGQTANGIGLIYGF